MCGHSRTQAVLTRTPNKSTSTSTLAYTLSSTHAYTHASTHAYYHPHMHALHQHELTHNSQFLNREKLKRHQDLFRKRDKSLKSLIKVSHTHKHTITTSRTPHHHTTLRHTTTNPHNNIILHSLGMYKICLFIKSMFINILCLTILPSLILAHSCMEKCGTGWRAEPRRRRLQSTHTSKNSETYWTGEDKSGLIRERGEGGGQRR